MTHPRPATLGVLSVLGSRRRIVVMLGLAVVIAAGVVFGGLVVLANRVTDLEDRRRMVDSPVFASMEEVGYPGRRDLSFSIRNRLETVTREELQPLRLAGFIEAGLPKLTGEHSGYITELGLPLVCAGRMAWSQRQGSAVIASESRGTARVQVGSVMLDVPTWISFPRFSANVAMLTPMTFAGVVLAAWGWRSAWRGIRRRAGRCPGCGYDARGLARCPECGEAHATPTG
jgi:hypothetical protein